MAIDYVAIANSTKALIDSIGRTVTLVKHDRTPADAAKPWNGPADPRLTPAASVDVKAVFVEPRATDKLGVSIKDNDLFKGATEIALVGPGSSETNDFGTFDELREDDGQYYRITGIEKLRPAGTTLLYFIGVAR
jgi:hypothetical protein